MKVQLNVLTKNSLINNNNKTLNADRELGINKCLFPHKQYHTILAKNI